MDPMIKKDQIYLLLFEPGMAELLYVLLTKKDYSAELKEKILKVCYRLIHSSVFSWDFPTFLEPHFIPEYKMFECCEIKNLAFVLLDMLLCAYPDPIITRK